ncbi:JAB1/MPN/MOV34 metalloenzyme domain-containing protein [Hirschfeldia incana]|nr:JAB1/MPN/MOV34 metalloenzyme domain-containing protein [Hirschfeldia incana]
MDVTETQQITEGSIEKVVVHPLVLRNIVDDYNRVAKDSGKRVVGALLGRSLDGVVEVINSYPVPFKENDEVCGLDHRHQQSMLQLFHGINDMVGWYSTGLELRDNDLDVHAQFCKYASAPNPVLVVIDVGLGIPTNAYYTMSSLEKMEKVFVRVPVEVAPHEVKEEFGEEHLLSDVKDTNFPKRITLGGVSFVDAMESYMEFYKNQVRISVEGYDISLRAVDLDISLVNHFSSCGNVEFVEVPRDAVTNAINGTSTTVVLRGEGAAEKALALHGSDVGGWRVSVKILPPALSSLRSGLTTHEAARQYVAHFKRYKSRGITVKGYDYSLCEADVKRALVNHFFSCGEITDVFVFKRRALVYFFDGGAVGKALKLCRPSQRRVTGTGFRARAMPIPKRLVVHGLDTPTY